MENRHDLGRSGEDITANWYQKQGFQVVARNFQYYRDGMRGRFGEIDLIVYNTKILCFVEVKTRTGEQFGLPHQQITKSQLKTLYKTIQYFYSKFPYLKNLPCRFDAALITKDKLEVIADAWNFDGFML
jgi:putative endonuclease